MSRMFEVCVSTATPVDLDAAEKPGWSTIVTVASHMSFTIHQGGSRHIGRHDINTHRFCRELGIVLSDWSMQFFQYVIGTI